MTLLPAKGEELERGATGRRLQAAGRAAIVRDGEMSPKELKEEICPSQVRPRKE